MTWWSNTLEQTSNFLMFLSYWTQAFLDEKNWIYLKKTFPCSWLSPELFVRPPPCSTSQPALKVTFQPQNSFSLSWLPLLGSGPAFLHLTMLPSLTIICIVLRSPWGLSPRIPYSSAFQLLTHSTTSVEPTMNSPCRPVCGGYSYRCCKCASCQLTGVRQKLQHTSDGTVRSSVKCDDSKCTDRSTMLKIYLYKHLFFKKISKINIVNKIWRCHFNW